MFRAILSLVNVKKKEEEKPALLLLGYGFFMGVFLATYRVVVETLFLNTMGEYLKEAFFISGLLGVVSTWLYMIMQKRISFARLTVFILTSVFVFIVFIFLNISSQSNQLFIFILYIMLAPVTSIMLLSFWGLFGRIFDIRQSKRIIGSIDAGQLIATILAFISVPFFIEYVSDVTDILIISVTSIAACFIFLLFVNKQMKFSVFGNLDEGSSEVYRFGRFFKDNYAILLSVFIAISVICVTFVDYSFLKITEQQYPDQNSLAKFLSYIYLSIMIFTLVMQTFVNDRLISSYGLKIGLVIMPIVLGIFTIAAILSGTFFGFTTASGSFIWFFLFIGLSKFFSNALRDSLENPTFKIFFMPLNINIRFDFQAKVEGVINETARLIAGGLIFVIGMLSFFELIHYSYFLIFIVIGYFFVTGKLYNEYRNEVRKKLESHEQDFEEYNIEMIELDTIIRDLVLVDNSSIKIFALKVIERIDQEKFRQLLSSLIEKEQKIVKKFALLKLNEFRNLSGVQNPNNIKIIEDTKKGKEAMANWLYKLLNASEQKPLVESLSTLIHSEEVDSKLEAINIIISNPEDETIPYLIELLNDANFSVQSAAITTAGKMKRNETFPFLIDKLSSTTYGDLAINALVEIGDEIIQHLDIIFQKTEQDPQTQLRIIKVYERIGSMNAKEILWSKIDYPDKKIVAQVLIALANSDFRADTYQNVRIKYVIESDISDIIWNLHALDKIPNNTLGRYLKKSIEEENQNHFRHIYMLLSMIFDKYSINLIRSNIESGTNEGISYAIELLDVLLSEDLKDRIVPLFDDISNAEKIKRLQVFYPHMLGDFRDVVKQIINKEFNQINRWSKTLALYWVGVKREDSMLFELVSNLFNPDPLIRDTAAWSLYQINPDYYEEHTQRIGKEKKMELDNMILTKNKLLGFQFVKPLSMDKAFFLSDLGIFKKMPMLFLVNIIDLAEELYLNIDQKLKILGPTNTYFYVVYEGYVNLIQNGIVINNLVKGEFIGEFLIEELAENALSIHSLTNSVLLRIHKEKFYELLCNDHELALNFIDHLYNKSENKEEDISQTA